MRKTEEEKRKPILKTNFNENSKPLLTNQSDFFFDKYLATVKESPLNCNELTTIATKMITKKAHLISNATTIKKQREL
jgi:hypothetical protein